MTTYRVIDVPANGSIGSAEREAFAWACQMQGYTGTWEEWQAMDAYTRHRYELGAAGIPTG